VPDTPQVRLALSPLAKLAALLGGLILLGVLGVLIAVLGTLESARQEITTTRKGVVDADARVQRVTGQLDPLLSAAQPLGDAASRRKLSRGAGKAASAIDELPGLADTARKAADAAVFVAQDVREADLGATLRSVRALADAGLAGDRLARFLDAAQTAIADVDPRTLGRAADRADRALANLARPGPRSVKACEKRLEERAPTSSGQVACLLRMVPNLRAILLAQLRANRRSLGTQQSQLSVNRRTLDLFRESIVIQRELLERVRSLDRKSGGTAPATPVTP
jgi:hypothetical protein